MKDVSRDRYMALVKPFIGQPTIKAITGVRRCGKSFMMRLIRNHLKSDGVPESRILVIDLDDFGNRDLLDAENLFRRICSSLEKVPEDEKLHIFVDEPQYTEGWENVIASILKDPRADVYITGSNSRLLSSELSTHITGRYVSIHMNPLTFSEYLDFRTAATGSEAADTRKEFLRFRRTGGFPLANISDYDEHASDAIVRDILESIVSNDVVKRAGIRRPALLNRILAFTLDNIGNPFSTQSLVKNLERSGIKADVETVTSYLGRMSDAYLIIPVRGYNLRGAAVMESVRKFYVADVSLVYAASGYKSSMLSGIEENIVAVELLCRGYDIYVGKTRSGKEVDFVAVKGGSKVYVQVTHRMDDPDVREREISALKEADGVYHRYVVVGEGTEEDVDGINVVPIEEFLLREEL